MACQTTKQQTSLCAKCGKEYTGKGSERIEPSDSALQAATILVAMASGKNFWRDQNSGESRVMVTILQLKVAKRRRFEKVSLERCDWMGHKEPGAHGTIPTKCLMPVLQTGCRDW